MTRDLAPPTPRPRHPSVAEIASASSILKPIAYVGELGLLVFEAVRTSLRREPGEPALAGAIVRQLDGLLGMGMPLVGLATVPLGSFLAMQAYFRATFTEAVGAVTGLGLLRNMGPLMTGLVLAGLLSARFTPELRGRRHDGIDSDAGWTPDRDAEPHATGQAGTARPARLAAARLAAAAVAGPVLALWGCAVGTLVGVLTAREMLHVAPAIFLGKLFEMIEPVDVVGLVVKGTLYATASALMACHEGLRPGSDAPAVRAATLRATCLAIVSVLCINASWFTVAYLGTSPFGPSLAAR